MTSTEIRLPDPPHGGPDVTIVRWLKRPGDQVAAGDPLVVVANDRVELALPAGVDGTIEHLLVAEGGAAAAGASLASVTSARYVEPATPPEPPAARPDRRRLASPAARRAASLAGVELDELPGSGVSGRIMKSDVLASLAPSSPTPPAAGSGRATVAASLAAMSAAPAPAFSLAHRAFHTLDAPHALTAMEVDMGCVAEVRARLQLDFARRGLPLGDLACVALAAVEALARHPLLNGMWHDGYLILRRRVHLAVARANGATVTLPDAQDLNLRGLARALARSQSPDHVAAAPADSTFTIAERGGGAWFGTPSPGLRQSAALGLGAAAMRPVVISGGQEQVVARPVALLTLAYDARVLDQHHADAFLRDIKRRLEHFSA